MRILKIILVILLLIPNLSFADDQLERNKITKNLRCLICQGQSVYDSDSDFANSLKILVDKKTDEILGAHIIGHDAGQLIAEIVTTIEFGGSAEDIARVCHAHPTTSEAVKEAALSVDGRAIHI